MMHVIFECNTHKCENKLSELIPMGHSDFISWCCGTCHLKYVIEIFVAKEKKEDDQ